MKYKKHNYNEKHSYNGNQNVIHNEYVSVRCKKYYFKNRWIFTGIAIVIVLAISVGSLYLQRQKTEKEYVIAEIVYVIDGDTIIASWNGKEHKVRMIGIDAPESVSATEEENTVYGELASEYTKANLQQGMKIYLTFDQERTDIYGRTLAYIWLDKDFENMNNLYQNQMVSAGYAIAVKYEPNILYWQVLEASMLEAITNKSGLWDEEPFYEENNYTL